MARRSLSSPGVTIIVMLLLAACTQLLAFWPGIIVWDSIRQYGQALSGHYDDWHPPAMNWLWRQLLSFGSGPAPMLALQALLYWGGFMLLAIGISRRSPAGYGRPLLLLCALLPVPFFMVGTILKDSLMAGGLLMAAGLLAVRRRGDNLLRVVAIVLLIATATLRFNAAIACLPLLIFALPDRWKRTRTRMAIASTAAAVSVIAALPLANHLLRAERSGVELSLVTYDLAGITFHSGVDMFPPLQVANSVAVNARCYSPVSWDHYAWWVDEPCPIQFADLKTSFKAASISPYLWLARATAAHPLAYLAHRLAHFDRNLRFWVHDADLPGLSLQSDPNPWNIQVPPSRLRQWIGALTQWSLGTPLGWPACWLALAMGTLAAGSASSESIARPVAWSAVLYGLSYLPLSVASEVRYHVWTMTGAAISYVIAMEEGRTQGAMGRLFLAPLAFAAIAILCVFARLAS
jgi:hypothetical protein